MNTTLHRFVLSITACSLCGSPVEYTNNRVVYGKSYGAWPMIYLCTNSQCRAYVHCHPGSTTPLGTMADGNTRRMRKAAHDLFDQLWQSQEMSRLQAYDWLADQLEIAVDKCHIGMFDATQCQRVIDVMKAREI